MKIQTMLLLFFTTAACGCAHSNTIEEDMQPYVDRFVEDAELYNCTLSTKNLSIGFIDANEAIIHEDESITTLAQCTHYTDGDVEIEFVKVQWDKMSPIKRERVMYHELGHCLLDKGHHDDIVMMPHEEWKTGGQSWEYGPHKRALSLMHSLASTVSDHDYNKYKREYMIDLFVNNIKENICVRQEPY